MVLIRVLQQDDLPGYPGSLMNLGIAFCKVRDPAINLRNQLTLRRIKLLLDGYLFGRFEGSQLFHVLLLYGSNTNGFAGSYSLAGTGRLIRK